MGCLSRQSPGGRKSFSIFFGIQMSYEDIGAIATNLGLIAALLCTLNFMLITSLSTEDLSLIHI